MKRKVSDPAKPAGFALPHPNPKNRSDSSCKKAVKFTIAETRRPPRIKSGDAKTSEYAFFKKLKEDASRDRIGCSSSNEGDRGRDSNPRDCSRERTNVDRDMRNGVRPSMIDKDAVPGGFEPFGTRPGSDSRNTDWTRAHSTSEDPHGKQKCMVEETGKNTLKPKGKGLDLFEGIATEDGQADVFDRKRRKLLHWVRETSFPEIDGLCSNGSSLVSFLLSRLIPKSKNKNVKNPEVPADKVMPLPSFESDTHFKELQLPPSESFMDLSCDPFLGNGTLSFSSKRSREMVSYSYSPANVALRNHLDYTMFEPGPALLGRNANSCLEHDMLPFEEYGLWTSGLVKEMDISLPHEYMYGREPCFPVLGWDIDRMVERKLSSFSRQRACPTIDSDDVLPLREYGLRGPRIEELESFCLPNKYMVQKVQCPPMLGWDFDSTNNERFSYRLLGYGADSDLGGGSVTYSMGDADSVVPLNEFGIRESSNCKVLDVFCQTNKYFDGKEPCTLMLGWDSDSGNEERSSSNLLKGTGERRFTCITSDNNHDVERQYLEGNYDLQSDLHQIELPLILPRTPTCLNQASCIDTRVWECGSTLSPLHNDHCFKQTIINKGHLFPNEESQLQLTSLGDLYPSTYHALHFPREEGITSHLLTYNDLNIRCPNDLTHERTLDHLIEDDALCRQISLNRQNASKLGIDIDKRSWDGNDKDMSFGDWDVNYIQL